MGSLTAANRIAVPVWIVFLLLIPTGFIPVDSQAAEKYQHLVNCELHSGTCTQQLQGTDVRLEVKPRPVKAMTDLLFRVSLTGKFANPKKAPFIDLSMPGMNMGPNQVLLKPAGLSVYEGTGVIVRCPSGRKIWQATVTLPDVGAVRFVFDVIY